MSRVVPIQSDQAPGVSFFAPAAGSSGLGTQVGVEPNLVVSTITASQYVSSPQVFLSSLNGQAWPPPPPSDNLVVSTLTAANFVSTSALLTGSINGAAYPLQGGDVTVSSLTAANSVSAAQIIGISSINGAIFPPTAIGPNLVVSSLVAGDSITAPNINLSSINGSFYPPTNPNINDLTVSTLTAASTISAGQILTNQITNLSTIDATSVSATNIITSTINGVNVLEFTKPQTNYFSTFSFVGVSTGSVVLPNVWSGAGLSPFAGYYNSAGPFSQIPGCGFDGSAPLISTLNLTGDVGTTITYVLVGNIVS
jgi:hypothetical protein